MAEFSSFAAFARELNQMADEINVAGRAKITRAMGERAQVIAERIASGDLGGDPKFSGWKPVLETKLHQLPDGATMFSPTRQSAGPWTVAQFGRNKGNAGGFAGPGVNRRTGVTSRTKSGGVRKVRAVKSRRWNGYTQGKGTGDKVNAALQRELPVIAEQGVTRIIRKHFD
jgi:hypothetical protein